MSAMPSPDKNKPSTITGSRFVGGNYTRHEQRELTCSAVQYGWQKYGLFCKTRPPVSFVMSSEAELGEGTWWSWWSSAVVFDVALLANPVGSTAKTSLPWHTICILFVHLWELCEQNFQEKHLKLTKTRSLRSRQQTSWWNSSARGISLIGSHTATQETN